MPAHPDISYRTPAPPAPIEPFTLTHPAVPESLDGLTVLHISDLHVRRDLHATTRYTTILNALARTPADLIALTGDLMDEPGHEHAALDTLRALTAVWRPRLGAFCVFGNHDTPQFQRACARDLPSITFIGGRTFDLPLPGAILRLVGLDWPEDPAAVLLAAPPLPPGQTLQLVLAHHPAALIPVAELGLPLMLAGHTHAGQIRLHPRLAPHTSSDLPPHLATGALRLKNTLCCITRGLGDGVIEGLRINCPRQIPLYTFRRGPIGGDAARAERVHMAQAW